MDLYDFKARLFYIASVTGLKKNQLIETLCGLQSIYSLAKDCKGLFWYNERKDIVEHRKGNRSLYHSDKWLNIGNI